MINDVDIIEIVVSNKFPFGKQDFKYFIGYKDKKEIRRLHIFFTGKSICKRYADKTNSLDFMTKVENFFDKYNLAKS